MTKSNRGRWQWVSGVCALGLALTGCGAEPTALDVAEAELRSDPATALLQHRDIPYPSTQGRASLVGDFDGNGVGDVVEWMYDWSGTTGLSLTLARGRAGMAPNIVTRHMGDQLPRTLTPLVADISGDGRDDLVFAGLGVTGGTGLGVRVLISNGDGTWTRREQRLGDGITSASRLLTGDVDGDGRDDLVLLYPGASYVIARTKLSNGDGTWRAASEQGVGISPAAYPATTVHLGDVDGDGRADLVAAGWDLDGAGTGLAVRVRTSNGNGLWTTRDARFDTPREALDRRPVLRDLDDDGHAELALLSLDRLYLFGWSDEARTLSAEVPVRTGLAGFAASAPVVVADIDGDGLDDFSASRVDSRTVGGGLALTEITTTTFRTGALGGATSATRVFADVRSAVAPIGVDLDGDRRAEIVWHGGTSLSAQSIPISGDIAELHDEWVSGSARYPAHVRRVLDAVRRMVPRQCVAGMEDLVDHAFSYPVDGLDPVILILQDCASRIPDGSALDAHRDRVFAELFSILEHGRPASMQLVPMATYDGLTVSSTREDAMRAMVSALSRRSGYEASAGLDMHRIGTLFDTRAELCGLPLMHEPDGDVAIGDVARVAGCIGGLDPTAAELVGAYCEAREARSQSVRDAVGAHQLDAGVIGGAGATVVGGGAVGTSTGGGGGGVTLEGGSGGGGATTGGASGGATAVTGSFAAGQIAMSLGRGDSQRLRDMLDSICDSAGGGAASADSTSPFSPESCMSSSRVAEDMARVAGFAMMVEACVGELPDAGPISEGYGTESRLEPAVGSNGASGADIGAATWTVFGTMGGVGLATACLLAEPCGLAGVIVGGFVTGASVGSAAAVLGGADEVRKEGQSGRNDMEVYVVDVRGESYLEYQQLVDTNGDGGTDTTVRDRASLSGEWVGRDVIRTDQSGYRIEFNKQRAGYSYGPEITFYGAGGGVVGRMSVEANPALDQFGQAQCSGAIPSAWIAQCASGQHRQMTAQEGEEASKEPVRTERVGPRETPDPTVDSNSEACQALHGFLNERGGLDWDSYFGRGTVPPRRHYEYPHPDDTDPRIAAWIEEEMGDVWCLPPTEEPESPYTRACGAMLCGLGNTASVSDGLCQCEQRVGTRMPTDVLACGGLPNCPEGSTRASTGFGCACVDEGSLGVPEPACGSGGGGPVDDSGAVICPE